MLSICIALKNRSRVFVDGLELRLFPKCIDSIRRTVRETIASEVVVADWDSDDWPLAEWLSDALAGVPYRVVGMQDGFSRGRGLNAAAAAAQGDLLFFLDADCLLNLAVVRRGIECVQQGTSYFPIIFCFDSHEHKSGRWEHHGFGNCMVTRSVFEKTGGWPEYNRWGGEDDDFFKSVSRETEVVREPVAGFFHQWHPQDILWKDRYAHRSADEIAEIIQVREASRELASAIPAGHSFILIDDARFGMDEIDGRRVRPFLEQDGEYAGPPSDDATAILELERMRKEGVTFLAIAWMAFWWLEYYTGFHEHLRNYFRPIVRNDRLMLFDLQAPAR